MKFKTNPFTSNQHLMIERSACGVQSIICIHCKKKNNSAFKCLVNAETAEVAFGAGNFIGLATYQASLTMSALSILFRADFSLDSNEWSSLFCFASCLTTTARS